MNHKPIKPVIYSQARFFFYINTVPDSKFDFIHKKERNKTKFFIKMPSKNYRPGQRSYKRRSYARRTRRFMTNNARLINNTDTIIQIVRMSPQVTNNPFANNFFNGTSFGYNNSFESLILPSGWLTSSFP
jgi:hypothetical protein